MNSTVEFFHVKQPAPESKQAWGKLFANMSFDENITFTTIIGFNIFKRNADGTLFVSWYKVKVGNSGNEKDDNKALVEWKDLASRKACEAYIIEKYIEWEDEHKIVVAPKPPQKPVEEPTVNVAEATLDDVTDVPFATNEPKKKPLRRNVSWGIQEGTQIG